MIDTKNTSRLFEVQYWCASAPPTVGHDPDEGSPPPPDCSDVDADSDENLWPDYMVHVVSYETACDSQQAIELAMTRIGAPSIQHYLESMSVNLDDCSFLEAQDDRAKFVGNLRGLEE